MPAWSVGQTNPSGDRRVAVGGCRPRPAMTPSRRPFLSKLRATMPREKFAWASLPDEQLLKLRLKDLKVTVEGGWLEDCLDNLHGELEQRGVRVRPQAWISSEGFSPATEPRMRFPSNSANP